MAKSQIWPDILGSVITAMGLVVTVILFNTEQNNIQDRETTSQVQREVLLAKRTQWQDQREIYSQLTGVVGQISSNLYNGEDPTKSFKEFYEVFFGSLVFVEDEDVRKAVNLLHLDIKALQEGHQSLISEEEPHIRVIRSVDHLIKVLRLSSEGYRNEIESYQQHIRDERD